MILFCMAGNWMFNLLFNPKPMDEGFDLLKANATSLPPQETQLRDGKPFLTGPAPFLMNMLNEGQSYDVDVWLSTVPQMTFF